MDWSELLPEILKAVTQAIHNRFGNVGCLVTIFLVVVLGVVVYFLVFLTG